MKGLLTAYRVLATVVGVLLIPLFTGWGLELFAVGEWHNRGADLTALLGPVHGLLYMLFFITAVVLSQKARWPIGFTIVTLLSGTIVFVSFWAEHRATQRVLAENPELVAAAGPSS